MSYLPENYENDGYSYLIGYAENFQNCHLYNGDEFKIDAKPGDKFELTYIPILSQIVAPKIAAACQAFWKTVELTYKAEYGILVGTGKDQIAGVGERNVSIALDRSHREPYVVHIYVSPRTVLPTPPEDGSATGTGKQ